MHSLPGRGAPPVPIPVCVLVIMSACFHKQLLCICAGTKGLNRKTVSFVMSDPEARNLVNSLKQPAPPTQPRPERGFIRNHFPHLRLSSHGDSRKQRRASASASQAPTELDGFALTQQASDTLTDDDSQGGDSMSAVLLANAQPLSQRSGSLDRPPSLQRSSLRLSSSSTPSKPLLGDTHEVPSGELNRLFCLDAGVESSLGARPIQLGRYL